MQAAIDQLKAESYPVKEEDLVRLYPTRFQHINPYGRFEFEISVGLMPNGLRPLRST